VESLLYKEVFIVKECNFGAKHIDASTRNYVNCKWN